MKNTNYLYMCTGIHAQYILIIMLMISHMTFGLDVSKKILDQKLQIGNVCI